MSVRRRTSQATMMVGISNPATAEELVRLAARVTDAVGGEILLTHVVTVARQISLTTGQSSPEVIRARDFVQDVILSARSAGVAARGLVEVARSVEDGLLAAAESHAVGTILVGYSDQQLGDDTLASEEERFDRTMHRVARKANADVVVAKLRSPSYTKIAVPVAIDTPLRLTVALCEALAVGGAAELTFLHIVEPGGSVDDARSALSARLEAMGMLGLGRLEVLASEALVDGLVAAMAEYDLVILTPSRRPGLLDRVYSSQAEKLAESVSASAILAWGGERES